MSGGEERLEGARRSKLKTQTSTPDNDSNLSGRGARAVRPAKRRRTASAGKEKRVLIITGMHRSGTSMIAHMVKHLGVNIGSDLIDANEGNPHGYYEDRQFVDFHDELLGRSGHRILVQNKSYLKVLKDDDVERAGLLIRQRSRRKLWGFKDPRTSLFLDFWSDLLPHAGFVFVLRHPLDVVASLMRRGFDSELEVRADPLAGLRSWEVYNRAISVFIQQQPERCVICDIYGVLEDPAALARTVRKKLGIPLRLKKPDKAIHREALHATLSSPRTDTILKRSVPRVASLYRKLEARADLRGVGHPSPDDDGGLELARRLEAITPLLSSKAADRVTTRPLLTAILAMLDPAAASLSGHDLRKRLSGAATRRQSLKNHCNNLEGRIAELESQSRHSGERVRELSEHCENLGRQGAERDATLADLRTHAGNLEAELAARQSAIEGLEARIKVLAAEHEATLRGLRAHAEDLEAELAARQRGLEGQEARIRVLTAEHHATLSGLRAYAENLEVERALQERTLASLEARIGSLEVEREPVEGEAFEVSLHTAEHEAGHEHDPDQNFEIASHADS